MRNNGEWIGFDLDGTLAEYNGWRGPEHIGKPIQKVVNLLTNYMLNGYTVKIFTARVNSRMSQKDREYAAHYIKEWCKENIGRELEITSEKDFKLIKYFDDRAIQIETNTGRVIK